MKKILATSFLLVSTTLFVYAQTAVPTMTDDFDTATNSCVTLTYNLSYRSRDAVTKGEVSMLQDFLSPAYLNSEPTGFFGRGTEEAVKKFQRANGLDPVGRVGALTRAKIKDLSCGNVTTDTVKPITIKVTQPTSLVETPVPTSKSYIKTAEASMVGVNSASFTAVGSFIDTNYAVTVGYGTSNTNLSSRTAEKIFPINNLDYPQTYTASVAGLLPTTQYFYQARARNLLTGQEITGQVLSFMTKSIDASTAGITAILNPRSAASQAVIGGSTHGIAVYTLKTREIGSQAIVRQLTFTTSGVNAIETITVDGPGAEGIVAYVVDNKATISGLNIPVNSTGVDIPVRVKYAGFQYAQGNTGPLNTSISNVGINLSYIEAVTGERATVITNTTPVPSNKMTLVASKPTVVVPSSGTEKFSLNSNAHSKIGEVVVYADPAGKIAIQSFKFNVSIVGISGTSFAEPYIKTAQGIVPDTTVSVDAQFGKVSFNPSYGYEIAGRGMVTLSIYAKVYGTAQAGIEPQIITSLVSPKGFVWRDSLGGSTVFTDEALFNFPTNSYRVFGTTAPTLKPTECPSALPMTGDGCLKKCPDGSVVLESRSCPTSLTPSISSVQAKAASVGEIYGGETAYVYGSNFDTNNVTIYLLGTGVSIPISPAFVSPTQLTFTTPLSLSAGAYTIIVKNMNTNLKSTAFNVKLIHAIVPIMPAEKPICDYANPPEGCTYTKGPNYTSVDNCGMVLTCEEIQQRSPYQYQP